MTGFFNENLLLHSSVIINGKNCEISLFGDKIIWFLSDQSNIVKTSIFTNDIIAIRDKCDFSLKHRLVQSPKIINKNLVSLNKLRMVIYSTVSRSSVTSQWDIMSSTVCFDDHNLCTLWKTTIKYLMERVSLECERPKSLAVFINPIGGSRKGVDVYYSKVKPIFDLAGIRAEVTVTTQRDEAKDYILNHQQSLDVDGLVCVGGDGMLMELIQGLLLKARFDAGHSKDNHHPHSPEFPSPLPVGIIAAGSTDSVAYSTIGTRDVITSALHIVKGCNISLDALTVYAGNTFLRYNISLMGYGFFGNCIAESETLRWMGPKRYDWLGFKHFMSLTSYYGELRYLPVNDSSGDPRDGNVCEERCVNCSEDVETDQQKDWITVRDRFVAINSFLISCRCKKSPIGPAPYAHLGNGCSDLVIVRVCNRFNFFKHLLKSASYDDHFDFDFVETVRVSEFTFTPLCNGNETASVNCDLSTQSGVWNCDGEPIYSPNVSCKNSIITPEDCESMNRFNIVAQSNST